MIDEPTYAGVGACSLCQKSNVLLMDDGGGPRCANRVACAERRAARAEMRLMVVRTQDQVLSGTIERWEAVFAVLYRGLRSYTSGPDAAGFEHLCQLVDGSVPKEARALLMELAAARAIIEEARLFAELGVDPDPGTPKARLRQALADYDRIVKGRPS